MRLPIAVPYQSGLGIHAGKAGACPIEPFLVIKALPGHIAQRDVRHPQVVHKPWATALVARNALPEKGQLKTEPVPVGRLYIPRVIPPLRLIILMIEVVSRKRKCVT